jgi:hypothetical protein
MRFYCKACGAKWEADWEFEMFFAEPLEEPAGSYCEKCNAKIIQEVADQEIRNKPSQYYENVGDLLSNKDEAVRAYRVAQNHLPPESPTYLEDFKRLQNKIITALG